MSFSDVIKSNRENNSPVSWWPQFAYHYTDTTNVVGILHDGFLYSRLRVTRLERLKNENASRQVINVTDEKITSNVRFYFRPQTPTQYYNEGYKHKLIRYDDDVYANIPVPIFLLFDLEKMLNNLPKLSFSNQSQAGHGDKVLSGLQDFEKLNFKDIYSKGYCEEDIRKFRHAELLYPDTFAIEDYLQVILCRNEMEKSTLINLLKEKNSKELYKYKDKIKICKDDLFYKNGLYIADCAYFEKTVSITFSDMQSKYQYTKTMMDKNKIDELTPTKVSAIFEWVNASKTLHALQTEFEVDYLNTKPVAINGLPNIDGAKTLNIKIYFEDKLMCYASSQLGDIELF